MRAYHQDETAQVYVSLEVGEGLGAMSGPGSFAVGMSEQIAEYRALEALIKDGKIVIEPYYKATTK